MIRILVFMLCVLALPKTASAGPWLREKGTAFLSTSVTANYFLDTTSQTYLEYGLTNKTTIIADIGFLRPRYVYGGGNVTLSLRRALSKPDATSKWAYELGVGVGWNYEGVLPTIRTALTWGRGVNWGKKSGWATVEAAGLWDINDSRHVIKIDGTVGINFTEVTGAMLQLYTSHQKGSSIATIAPSLIISPKKSKFRIQIGGESEIGNRVNSKLKISLWREF